MDAQPARPRAASILVAVVTNPVTLWMVFIAVHVWLGLVNLYSPSAPLGDVTSVYKFWTDQAIYGNFRVGIDSAWVYPIVAMVPMLAATVLGPEQYGSTWLTMVLLLDAVALGFLTGWGRSRERVAAAWWWVAFLLLLGPVALGRIDAVTVPIALVGVVLIAARPRVAAVLIAVAMWIKIWPAALVGAALIALRDRWRVLGAVLVVSVVIIGIALVLGSGANVLSFITQQTGRGIQVESPVATLWLWRSLVGDPTAYVYWEPTILTYQVEGDGVQIASAIMTPLLVVALLAAAAVGVRAVRAGAAPGDLLPALSLALVTTLIAVNKVGSPQFICWLAVPVVLGLATSAAGHGRSFRFPAVVVLVIAALTQVVYPYLYDELLAVHPLMVAVLTARNVLEFVLLGWAVLAVVRSPQQPAHDEPEEPPADSWLPSVWPFADRQATTLRS